MCSVRPTIVEHLLGTTYTHAWRCSCSFIKFPVLYVYHLTLVKKPWHCLQLGNTVCNLVSSLTSQHCPSLIPDAQAIAERFREAFTLFGRCHNIKRIMWLGVNKINYVRSFTVSWAIHMHYHNYISQPTTLRILWCTNACSPMQVLHPNFTCWRSVWWNGSTSGKLALA